MQERIDIRVDADVEWPTTQREGQWFTTGTAFTRGDSRFIELKNHRFGAVVDHMASAKDLDRLNQRSWTGQ